MTDLSATATAVAPRPRGLIRAIQVALVLVVALRLYMALVVAPIGDEAYYWMWGQELDLSYFDHPPLNAWLMRVMSLIFGWNIVGLRALAWFTSAGTVYLLYLWSRQLYGANWERMFWIGTLAYFATPLFFIYSQLMFNDHLLIPLVLWSVLLFTRFFESWEAGSPLWRQLYLAALVLGFAALTKYNAAFVAVGVGIYILSGARRRLLLLQPRLYLAALITLLVLTPVIVWNLQHGLASMNYNIVQRNTELLTPTFRKVLAFLWPTLLHLSPIYFFALGKILLFTRARSGFESAALGLGRSIFVASTGVMLVIALGSGTAVYWNIVAYVPLVPFVAAAIGGRVLLWLQVAYGLLLVSVAAFNYTVAPIETFFRNQPDWESSVVYGWPEVKAAVAAAEAEYDPDFIVASRYTTAAQLSFVRGKNDVTEMSQRLDQYDFWWRHDEHVGQTALMLSDRMSFDERTLARFGSVEEVARVDVVKFGKVINTFVLSIGRDYQGAPPYP